MKNNQNRTAVLNLSSILVSREVCETLEDVLKVVNFRTIIIKECEFTQETIREFLNMLEYYESVSELVLSQNFDDSEWRTLCSIVGKSNYLESITFKEVNISDSYMRTFVNNVKLNENITTLRFDSCGLAQLPTFQLSKYYKICFHIIDFLQYFQLKGLCQIQLFANYTYRKQDCTQRKQIV